MQVNNQQLAELFDYDSPIDPSLNVPPEWTGVRWEWGATNCKAILAADGPHLRQLEYESLASWVLDTPGRCDGHVWRDAQNEWVGEYAPERCDMEEKD